ncbi:MAG: helix-turn-helix transcriptional regulator [Pseudomonadota bacterium]
MIERKLPTIDDKKTPTEDELKKSEIFNLGSLEIECLQLLSDGYTYLEIAEKHSLSELTVRLIISNASTKLGATSQPHAVKIALKSGLIHF